MFVIGTWKLDKVDETSRQKLTGSVLESAVYKINKSVDYLWLQVKIFLTDTPAIPYGEDENVLKWVSKG